ncbi:MAG: crossover junction endodeoxyribonuclease RuvC [Candidatus Omnitrophica bacterium 4484_213]|nr:MAG: crossover junction endodeoxyribonuclease RuvC [Candidatus Omnitrophica bacterium 4484_213]
MRILGIDPGTVITGFGVVEKKENKLRVIDYGIIKPKSRLSLVQRLKYIYKEINQIIKKNNLDILVIEDIFFHKNFRSAAKIGEARSVAILAAANQNLEVIEYLPTEIKQSVIGNGRASKVQVQNMVKRILGLSEIPFSDAADALAAAICHCHKAKS